MDDLFKLQIEWSEQPDPDEEEYRSSGCVRTVGTHFCLPPSTKELVSAFETSHLGTPLSCGAKALCKHYARLPQHPVWKRPHGSPQNKSKIAKEHLTTLLSNAVWRNVHTLPHRELVYEIRDEKGFGMRWTLYPAQNSCSFRGYLEGPKPVNC